MKEEIRSTMNYDLFDLHEFNRNVETIKSLEESMKKHGWLSPYPMHVERNGSAKLKIKAGHHRFTVARKLGIPVKYIISNDDSTIHELEASTIQWSVKDFLYSNYRLHKDSYVEVKTYHEITGIPITTCVSLLGGDSAGSGNHNKSFRIGSYRLGDTKHAYQVAEVVLELKKLKIEFASSQKFVSALSKAMRVEAFNTSLFIDRVDTNLKLMTKQASMKDYLDLIDRVYNHGGRTNRLPVAFLADEIARERCAAKKR